MILTMNPSMHAPPGCSLERIRYMHDVCCLILFVLIVNCHRAAMYSHAHYGIVLYLVMLMFIVCNFYEHIKKNIKKYTFYICILALFFFFLCKYIIIVLSYV